MPIYISMLRGINVGGHKLIKMDQLRKRRSKRWDSSRSRPISRAETWFSRPERLLHPSHCRRKSKRRFLATLAFQSPSFREAATRWPRRLQRNPFLKEREIDQEKLHVMFLSEAPAPSRSEKVGGPDRCAGPVSLSRQRDLLLPPERSFRKRSDEKSCRPNLGGRHHHSQLENRQQPPPDVPGLPLMRRAFASFSPRLR